MSLITIFSTVNNTVRKLLIKDRQFKCNFFVTVFSFQKSHQNKNALLDAFSYNKKAFVKTMLVLRVSVLKM